MYKRTVKEGPAGADGGAASGGESAQGGGRNKGDDVVDADFEEVK